MILEIPIHPISKKIITADYGPEPIRLKKNDQLLHQLTYQDPKTNRTYLSKLLSCTIKVELSSNYARLARKREASGYHIYKYHVDRIIRYIEAHFHTGLPAYPAMLQFYDIYDIDDDDIRYDAIYKKWQRHKSTMNPSLSARIQPRYVHSDVRKTLLLSDNGILDYCNVYLNAIRPHLFTKRGQLSQKIIKKVLIYIHHEVAKLPIKDIATRFDITECNVRRNIKTFQTILDLDENIPRPSLEASHGAAAVV